MNGTMNPNNNSVIQRNSGSRNQGFIDNNCEQDDSDNSSNGSGASSDDEDVSLSDTTGVINRRSEQDNNVDDTPVSWKTVLKGITIEPMMFAQMMGLSISAVVLQNLYIERICKVSLKYEDAICDNLTHYKDIDSEIDEIASKYVTYRSLIEAGFPIIVSLFLGPWTDIHGTKWPMLLPLLGYCLSGMSYVMFSLIPQARPELLLISSIPISLVGGLVAFVMSTFSYMSKRTDVKTRSFRVAMLEAAWFLGSPVGVLTGGLIYKNFGFTAVFATSATLFFGSFIYGFFVIREEVSELASGRNCCADMVNIKAVKDMLATVFLRRSGLQRRWLLLMLLTISLRIFALFGYIQNMYLYTRKKVNWDLAHYTAYSVSDSFIAISGGYVMIMTCMKIFQLPDSVIGILSTVGIIFSQFIFAFATHGWMIYLGSCCQMFAGLISIVLRSMISKVVAKEEIARVFTFLACGEATMPLLGVPLYSYVFRHSPDSFPGAMFMISAGTYMTIFASFIYLYFSMRRSTNHVQMEDPTESSA